MYIYCAYETHSTHFFVREKTASILRLRIKHSQHLYAAIFIYQTAPLYISNLEVHIAIGGNCRMRTLFIRNVTKFRNDNNTKLHLVNQIRRAD